jgi:hypothetical protein
MRIAVLHNDFGPGSYLTPFVNALGEAGCDLFEVQPGWTNSPPCLDGYDAAVVYVYFRELQQSEPISWGAFSGAKVLYEQDAVHNYVRMVDRTLLRAWPPELKRHRFDAVVSTGRDVAGWLSTDGFPAHWLPKGFDATSFHFDRDRRRGGFCTYGTPYLARAAMWRKLRQSDTVVTRLNLPFAELPDRLNDFAAGVVCNLAAYRRGRKLGVALNRIRPGSLLRLTPGVEPMMKNFEIPGCGAALVCDYIPELEDLGFVDGRNAIFYRTFDELVDVVRTGDADRLREVGAAGARLVHGRHTWRHRAHELVTELPRWLDNPTA